ncbi:MAG: hypothetical protein J6T80_08100 [Paludibacteraceae bacterium]|nr:hypothetical protein [Paludibacteraceae bacterium]
MKKLLILAMSAIFAANLSAQEVKAAKAECKKDAKECKMSKEERIERDIKMLTEELYLGEEQAAKFAVTYREYAGKLDAIFAKKKAACEERGKELSDKELDQLNKERLAVKKEIILLKEKFYDKFRKDLNPRQAERAINFRGCKCKQGGPEKPFPGRKVEMPRGEFQKERPMNGGPHGPQPKEFRTEKKIKE